MNNLAGLLIVAVMVIVYFLPTILAANKVHKNMGAIAALNILAGWTFLGWLIALIWACTPGRTMAQEMMEYESMRQNRQRKQLAVSEARPRRRVRFRS